MSDMKHIAKAMSQYGRRSDDHLVHMSGREVAALNRLAPNGLTTNPVTGLPEAFSLEDLIGPALTAGAAAADLGEYTPYIAGAVGLGTYAATGNLSKGIAAGLLSYGAGEAANYAMGNSSIFGPGDAVTTSGPAGAPNSGALGALTASGAVAPTSAMIQPVDMERIYEPDSPLFSGLKDSTIATATTGGSGIMAAASEPGWWSRNSSWALPGGLMALGAMAPAGSGNVPKAIGQKPANLPPMVNGPVARPASMPSNFNYGYGPEQVFFPEAQAPQQQMAMQQASAFTSPEHMQAQLALEAGGSGSAQQQAMLARQLRGYAAGGAVSQTYRPSEQSFQMPLPNMNIALGSPTIKVAGGGYIDPRSPYVGYSMGQPGTPGGLAEQGYHSDQNIPTSFAGVPGMPALQPIAQPQGQHTNGSVPSGVPNDSAFGANGIAGGIGGNAGGVDSGYGFTYPGGGSMDGKEYQFLNDLYERYQKAQLAPVPPVAAGPEQMVAPSPAGPMQGGGSTDQGWDQYSPTGGPGGMYNADIPMDNSWFYRQPQTAVSAREEGQGWITGQSGLPSLPDHTKVSQPSWFERNGWDIGRAVIGAVEPTLGTLNRVYNFGEGAWDGYKEGRSGGPLGTQYVMDLGKGVHPVDNSPSIGSQILNGSNTLGNFAGRMVGKLVGGDTIEAMTPAQMSAHEAYGKGQRYDTTGNGWVADPSKDWVPQALPPAEMGLVPSGGEGQSSGGSYQNWYTGQADPYSMTGNMNAPNGFMAGAGFGAGRYENAQNPYANMGNGYNQSGPDYLYMEHSLDGLNHGRGGGGEDYKNTDTNAEGGPIRRHYAEGGQVQAPPEVQQQVIEGAKAAILGQSQQPEQAIQQFLQLFGQEALRQLVQQVQGHSGPVKGAGDGVDDFVPAMVDGVEPVRLANDEHVIDAATVSHLGNGSSEAGHKVLQDMVKRVRMSKTGKQGMPESIEPEQHTPV